MIPTSNASETEPIVAKAPYAKCWECPLRDQPCVPSYKPQGEISLIIVGEAPGYHEVQQGKPFVGPSGKLLDAVLKHIDIDPTTVYRTNAVLCRPPKNDLSRYPQAVQACQERLKNELDQITCNTIVALGNTALLSLDAIAESYR
jgi:uracil-DNA glycosylase family 4